MKSVAHKRHQASQPTVSWGDRQLLREYVNCNCCGSDNLKFYASAKSHFSPELFQVVKCNVCGLIFVNPRIANKEKEIAGRKSGAAKTQALTKKDRSLKGLFVLKKISRYKTAGNFLDFGCGSGSLVREAESAGWNAYGYELNRSLAEAANAYWQTDRILSGSIEELKQQYRNCFDAINASQVFEHLTDPLGTAKDLAILLRKGGILSLDVPNINRIIHLLNREASLNPSGHLYHFSSRTLSKLLVTAGFEILEVRTSLSGTHLVGKIVKNKQMAASLAYRLYRLPTCGFGLNVVAIKRTSHEG